MVESIGFFANKNLIHFVIFVGEKTCRKLGISIQ